MSPSLQPPSINIKVNKLEKQWIGSASMEEDGTIILRERLFDKGFVGDTVERIKPGTPHHDKVRKHLPDLSFGHPVSVYDDWD